MGTFKNVTTLNDLNVTGDVIATGNVDAATFSGDGSGLTDVTGSITTTSGVTTRATGSTGTQTVTHSLGSIPSAIEVIVTKVTGTNSAAQSTGFYDAGGQFSQGWNNVNSSCVVRQSNTRVAYWEDSVPNVQWDVTLNNVTTTTFDLVWNTNRNDTGSQDLQIMWRVVK